MPAATYTTSAPVVGVDKKYKGSFGPQGDNKFSVAPCAANRKAVVCLLTASGDYVSGGNAITMADLPLTQVHAAYVVADDAASHTQAVTTGALAQFDLSTPTAPKLKWYTAANTEQSAATITGRTALVRLEGV